jgi:hypothetical protein
MPLIFSPLPLFGRSLLLLRKIIIRYEYGQLGNILFRLGNSLAYALNFGLRIEDYTLAFCNYHDGSSNIRFFENYYKFHFFEYPKPKSSFSNRIKWKFRNYRFQKIKKIDNFEPSFDLKGIKTNSSFELKGFHFSSGELVAKYHSEISQILSFRNSIIRPVNRLIDKTRSANEVLLGVHIRANDFKKFYKGKYFVQAARYLEIIDQFKRLKQARLSIGVIVCSDCPKVLREIRETYPSFIIHHGSVAQDMQLLSMCDYLLGPKASTFSAWSAFIGKIPIFQIDQNSKLESENDFKQVCRLEPFNLT